jgi:glucose/mannose-6-phosphate isomerase
MKDLVQNFSNQLREAKKIAEKAVISPKQGIQNIVITGLGGSGIGGSIISELVADKCSVPIIVNKDYFLPNFVNDKTLVIISSYSGNTEETVNALKEAIGKKAVIVAITSGGKVLDMVKQHQADFIEIPGGFPPRSCIGYSLVQLIKVLGTYGFAPASLFTDLEKSIALLEKENEQIKNDAKKIAEKLKGKISVIYSLGTCAGTAVRFCQQINENSKMLCWHSEFPEMNHNELVGWTTKNDQIAVVTLRTSFDYERTIHRYNFCKPLFESLSSGVTDIYAKGNSKLEQFLYLIHIGDWISCYLADLKGIDPVEVKVIDKLKAELAGK